MSKNTSDMALQRNMMLSSFVGDESIVVEDGSFSRDAIPTQRDIDEYDEAISDCLGMLYYAMDLNNFEEIRFWRRMLQQTKTEKRNALRLMKNYEKEVAAA